MDRKEAIERIKIHMEAHKIGEYPHIKLGEALSLAIEALQEPEIVRCKDCKHWDKEIMYCNHTGMQIEPNGYCVYGGRKDCWVTKAREEE